MVKTMVKFTDSDLQALQILSKGFYIQENRKNKSVRMIKEDCTEVHPIRKSTYAKLIKHEIVECITFNKVIANYKLTEVEVRRNERLCLKILL